ncbi:MAG: MFS transporter [Gaiellaceae bacterium]
MLATMASQALLVVLSPTITAIGDDFHHSVAAVGQARSVTAAVAIPASLAITARIGVIGVRRLLVVGSLGALVACVAVALAPTCSSATCPHGAGSSPRRSRSRRGQGVLTFVGAFFIQELDVGEAAAGWLLAIGAAAYVVASSRAGALAARRARRRLAAGAALAKAVILPLLLTVGETGVASGLALFCLAGAAAGIRTPASSGLALDQLPDHPGAMAGARTAVTQLGYLLGAVGGGALIAVWGWPARSAWRSGSAWRLPPCSCCG